MPKYIACYDLENVSPSPYSAFLTAAVMKGWSLRIEGADGNKYRLPNTTLIGSFDSRDAAVQALKEAHAAAEKEIEKSFKRPKWIVASYTDATFYSDDVR